MSYFDSCDGCHALSIQNDQKNGKWLCEMHGMIFCHGCYETVPLGTIVAGGRERRLLQHQNRDLFSNKVT